MSFTGWKVRVEKYFVEVSKTARGRRLRLLTKHDNDAVKLFIFPFVLRLKHCRNIHFNVQKFVENISVLFTLYKVFVFIAFWPL